MADAALSARYVPAWLLKQRDSHPALDVARMAGGRHQRERPDVSERLLPEKAGGRLPREEPLTVAAAFRGEARLEQPVAAYSMRAHHSLAAQLGQASALVVE